jgi:hypothetical protein
MAASGPPLEDCLRLLRGERDEQKLAGLLVAANVCRAGDADAVAKVYRAVGPRFLRRLLSTGKRYAWKRASWLSGGEVSGSSSSASLEQG